MNVIKGDIVELARKGWFDIIFHGCNCFCGMKSGVARSIAEAFPEAEMADLSTPKGDASKLGKYSMSVQYDTEGDEFLVLNVYTQYDYGRDNKDRFEYEAFEYFLENHLVPKIKKWPPCRVGYPKIGSGLAGGDWDRIEAILNKHLDGYSHTLVEYE